MNRKEHRTELQHENRVCNAMNPSPSEDTPFQLASLVANLASDKKASDIQVLNLQDVSPFADYFVVATVESRPQMQALVGTIVEMCKKTLGLQPRGIERDPSAPWTLVDFGDVILHIFNPESRGFYQLENFWSHAQAIPETTWTLANQHGRKTA